jgi:NAD(P)-dependent dehydrogenase (short-subunit alcohol dehydrogenase family)
LAAYSAAKVALENVTASIAKALAPTITRQCGGARFCAARHGRYLVG